MSNEEISTIISCIENIKDKLKSIELEILRDNPYDGYILEKITPIVRDSKCIENICKKGE